MELQGSKRIAAVGGLPAFRHRDAPFSALVAVDDPLLRWCLKETLVEAGADVTEATTSADARRIGVTTRPFELLIVDEDFPDGGGATLVDLLHRLHPESQAVLMVDDRDGDACRAVDRDVLLLVKPFDLATVELLAGHAADADRVR